MCITYWINVVLKLLGFVVAWLETTGELLRVYAVIRNLKNNVKRDIYVYTFFVEHFKHG